MNTSRLKLLGFFGAIILLSPTLSYSAQTNSTCDPSRIRIEQATSLEQKSACVAIRQLEDFFLKMAAPVTLDVTLKFENEVFLPLASTGGEKTRVYGYFDSDKFEVVQSHFRSAYQVGRRSPWSLKWSDALAHSFLLHELSHLAVMKYLKSIGRSERQVAPEWHEAIAYTIQFLLMDSRLRNQIFEMNQQTVADHIKEPARLASSNYREDPDGFAIRSAMALSRWGGMAYIKSVLDGKVPESFPDYSPPILNPVSLKYPMECTFKAIAKKRLRPVNSAIPLPTLRYQSYTSFSEFKAAVKLQGHDFPQAFSNAFAYAGGHNEIFLIDDPEYYSRHGRFIDDSLAHELLHFIQIRYQNYDLRTDEMAELEAIEIQTWFRETYMSDPNGPSPCDVE